MRPFAERGSPRQRLVRGLLWAVLAIFIISVLAFSAGQCMTPVRIAF
jgi:hypothetical protein